MTKLSLSTQLVLALVAALWLTQPALGGRGQAYTVERVEEGQKNYTKEEEGKIFPTKWVVWMSFISNKYNMN